MAADDLVTQGTKASAAMALTLTWLSWIIQVSAPAFGEPNGSA